MTMRGRKNDISLSQVFLTLLIRERK